MRTQNLLSLGFLLVAFHTWAQNSNFANCNSVNAEEKAASTIFDKEQRLRAVDQLTSDVRKLVNEKKAARLGASPFPDSFLTACIDRKRKTLAYHGKNADEGTRDSAAFLRAKGILDWLNSEISNTSKVKYLTSAYQALEASVAKNPKDWSTKSDRIQVYMDLSNARMKSTGDKHVTAADIDQYFQTTKKLSDELITDPQAPLETKIALMRSQAHWVKLIYPHKSMAVKEWQKLLKLKADDQEALIEISTYHYEHKNHKEALPFLIRLLKTNPNLPVFLEALIDSSFQMGDLNAVVLNATNGKNVAPRSYILHSRLARAWYGLGLLEKARPENKVALEINEKEIFARSTQSLLLEENADRLAQKKMLSAALKTYDEAYQFDNTRPILRRKMGILTYENRKNLNFEPKATALEEMKFITQLLDPIKERPELGPDGMEILIFAAKFASLQPIVLGGCNQFEQDYGAFTHVDTVKICAESYAHEGQKERGVKILKLALENQRFRDSKPQLRESLINLK